MWTLRVGQCIIWSLLIVLTVLLIVSGFGWGDINHERWLTVAAAGGVFVSLLMNLVALGEKAAQRGAALRLSVRNRIRLDEDGGGCTPLLFVTLQNRGKRVRVKTVGIGMGRISGLLAHVDDGEWLESGDERSWTIHPSSINIPTDIDRMPEKGQVRLGDGDWVPLRCRGLRRVIRNYVESIEEAEAERRRRPDLPQPRFPFRSPSGMISDDEPDLIG